MNETQTSGATVLPDIGEARRIEPPTPMPKETREAWRFLAALRKAANDAAEDALASDEVGS